MPLAHWPRSHAGCFGDDDHVPGVASLTVGWVAINELGPARRVTVQAPLGTVAGPLRLRAAQRRQRRTPVSRATDDDSEPVTASFASDGDPRLPSADHQPTI